MSDLYPLRRFEKGVSVVEAILSRKATRAFTDRTVSRECIETLIGLASRAPSGSNIQPWRVHVCCGDIKSNLSKALVAQHFSDDGSASDEYQYYPLSWREPYQARRRKVGFDLYGALGIAKGDKVSMSWQHARNYEFFGAPVGLFVTIPRDFPAGAYLDTGMFIQTFMLAARGVGLDTCPQQAFTKYHQTIRQHLSIPEEELILCGIALGFAETAAAENRIRTERESLENFVTLLGFYEQHEQLK